MSLTEWRGLFATTCTPFAPRGLNKNKKKIEYTLQIILGVGSNVPL